MHAAVLIAALAAVAPVEAARPGPVVLVSRLRFYDGPMPAEGEATPERHLGGSTGRCGSDGRAAAMSCQTLPAFREGGVWRFPFRRRRADYLVRPEGGLARVEVALYGTEGVLDTPELRATDEVPDGDPVARFAGVVPLGRPCRVGADGCWVEVAVDAEGGPFHRRWEAEAANPASTGNFLRLPGISTGPR